MDSAPAMLYRIIRSDRVSWTDFLSNQVRDQPRRGMELTRSARLGRHLDVRYRGRRAVRAQTLAGSCRFVAELRDPGTASSAT